MKRHPESILLIEKQNAYQWRIADRLTTAHGLSTGFRVVQDQIGELRKARQIFRAFKIGAIALAISVTVTKAAPPDGANPAFAPYFKSLRLPTPGNTWTGYSCTEADCREVDTRNNGGTMEVFIDKKTFGPDSGAPDDWVPVPKSKYAIPDQDGLARPVRAVACWYQGQLRCFDFPLTQG
jgi:hypothetical protein